MAAGRLPLLGYLARSELQRRYAGTAGGAAWTVLAPLALIGAMWLALDVGLGLRASTPMFGLNLVIGMVAWLVFADSVGDATSAVTRNPHLVKKVVFPVELLPLASVLSSLIVHLCVVAAVGAALAIGGSLHLALAWTLPFWIALALVMSAAIAFIVAGLNVVVRDTQAIAPFLITIWFWLTPIVWPVARLAPEQRWLAGLNPMAVVVEGYRTALTGAPYPFDAIVVAAAAAAAILCAGGALLFVTLRPSFADSL